MSTDRDNDIEFYQVPLLKGDMDRLKEVTGENTVKGALTKATKYYIEKKGGK